MHKDVGLDKPKWIYNENPFANNDNAGSYAQSKVNKDSGIHRLPNPNNLTHLRHRKSHGVF